MVAHHITLVNAQAGVAHHLLRSHPDRAHEALADIRETSRTALDELRATVGLLRQDDDPPPSRSPAPSFDDVDELIDSFRRSGLDVRVTREGEPRPLAGAADLAAYRIVQEALTNASKHGTESSAELGLRFGPGSLVLTVSNAARPDHRGSGTGHGLIGLRERAEAAGGRSSARLTGDGRFVVEAELPLRSTG